MILDMASSRMVVLLATALYNTLPATAGGSTPLVRSYEGSSFFDRWSYFGKYDNTTNGDVVFANQSVATATPELTYITSSNTAIIKVDNTSTVPYNEKRNSIKILSEDAYDVGSVWVLDAVHIPYGCSVWPGFWSYSEEGEWPTGGEIDTVEGVNNQVGNQMALHTEDGCSITSGGFSGIVNDTSCYYSDNSNSGCGISDSNTTSYGPEFASAGGGVWVTELAESGISIWFFSRSDVPSSITNASDSIDTSGLGTPVGYWSNTGCEITKFFGPQTLVFDITLCGSWAGQSSILASTGCSALSGTSTCYSTYVLDSSNYADAYFEINSLKVYSNESSTTSATSASSSAERVLPIWGPYSSLLGLALLLAAGILGLLSNVV